jgi:hypothetical protein
VTNVLDLISKIGRKEAQITQQVFISPVFYNALVATRIDGLIYSFTLPAATEYGWYCLQPVDTKKARIVEQANLIEREMYLKNLDKLRIVLVMKKDGIFYGVPDKANKFGFQVNDLLPIFLCDDMPMDFDRVITRFDGANIWFDQIDQSNDPAKAEYLRNCMTKVQEPEKIKFSGLSLEEKFAYTLRLTVDKKLVIDRTKDGLKQDVEFAGGSFLKFVERSDHFSVTYKVNGQEYTSYVSKDPVHSVISAGLCLQGNDKRFDLKSLVTVIREGHQKGLIHHYHLRA